MSMHGIGKNADYNSAMFHTKIFAIAVVCGLQMMSWHSSNVSSDKSSALHVVMHEVLVGVPCSYRHILVKF